MFEFRIPFNRRPEIHPMLCRTCKSYFNLKSSSFIPIPTQIWINESQVTCISHSATLRKHSTHLSPIPFFITICLSHWVNSHLFACLHTVSHWNQALTARNTDILRLLPNNSLHQPLGRAPSFAMGSSDGLLQDHSHTNFGNTDPEVSLANPVLSASAADVGHDGL